MNRTTNPHKGGIPRGHSWTRQAQCDAWAAILNWPRRYDSPNWRGICTDQARRTLITIRDHSRKPSTVAEAKRLLAILEATP